MKPKKTFVQQVAALFRGNIFHAFSQWAVITLISAFGGNSAAGTYVSALAMTAPVFMFFDLNLRVMRSTDHEFDEKFASYIGLRFYALVCAIVLSTLICFIFYPVRIGIIIPILAYRVGESISNLAYGGLQRQQSSHLIGGSLTMKGLAALVLLSILVPLTSGNPIVAACGMAVVSITWGIFRDLPLSWKINSPETPFSKQVVLDGVRDISSCTRIAKRAFPLGFDAGISSIAMNAPKYSIEYYLGTDILGVYGILAQLAFAIQKLIGAIGHTGVSLLSKQQSQNNRVAFWRLFNRLLGSSIVVGLLAVLGGTFVIPFVMNKCLGPEYGDYWLMFSLLLASCLAGAQRIAGRATQACSRYFAYTMFDVVIFTVSIIASIVLVQNYGAFGGGIALSIAFGFGLVVTLVHTYWFLWPMEKETEIKSPNEIPAKS